MCGISAIPYISLFCLQKTHTVIFIFFSCTIHYTFKVYFYTVRSMFPFLFNQSQLKAGVVNQISKACFRRRPNIGQLNVQTATAKKEKLYTLSKIIYTKF